MYQQESTVEINLHKDSCDLLNGTGKDIKSQLPANFLLAPSYKFAFVVHQYIIFPYFIQSMSQLTKRVFPTAFNEIFLLFMWINASIWYAHQKATYLHFCYKYFLMANLRKLDWILKYEGRKWYTTWHDKFTISWNYSGSTWNIQIFSNISKIKENNIK